MPFDKCLPLTQVARVVVQAPLTPRAPQYTKTGFISRQSECHASNQQKPLKTTFNDQSGDPAGTKYVRTLITFQNPFKLF